MLEAELMQKIQIEISRLGGRVFRNQVGKYRLKDGRYISSGLCIGSADLIGWYPISNIAVFLAIEVKTPTGRIRDEQRKFLDAVNRAGGIGFIARSVEDMRKFLLEKAGGLCERTGF